MSFVVLPAPNADISAVYDVYFAAFASDPLTHALFPDATDDDLQNPDSEFRYAIPLSLRYLYAQPSGSSSL